MDVEPSRSRISMRNGTGDHLGAIGEIVTSEADLLRTNGTTCGAALFPEDPDNLEHDRKKPNTITPIREQCIISHNQSRAEKLLA